MGNYKNNEENPQSIIKLRVKSIKATIRKFIINRYKCAEVAIGLDEVDILDICEVNLFHCRRHSEFDTFNLLLI